MQTADLKMLRNLSKWPQQNSNPGLSPDLKIVPSRFLPLLQTACLSQLQQAVASPL